MTPQERDLLDRFLSDLAAARPGAKDAEAAQRIEQTLRSNPDAAYVLVQHAIMADQALHQAQAQIEQLRARSGDQPSGGGGFLGGQGGGGYGAGQGGYPGQGGPGGGYPPQGGGSQGPASTSVPPSGGGGMFGGGGGGGGPFTGGGGLGGFLKQAGTAAAGVAGGAFLFEGLSNVFGGHRGGGFGGFGGGENVTINEFGDGDGGREGFADAGDYPDTGGDAGFDDDNNA